MVFGHCDPIIRATANRNKSFKLRQDRVGGRSPYERLAVAIVLSDEVIEFSTRSLTPNEPRRIALSVIRAKEALDPSAASRRKAW
jgi:hypothetical protein